MPREALARDHIHREPEQSRKITECEAVRLVTEFIQNVHHFRDECPIDTKVRTVQSELPS